MRIDIIKPSTNDHINALTLTRAAIQMSAEDEETIATLAQNVFRDMGRPMSLAFAKVVKKETHKVVHVLLSQPSDWADNDKVWKVFVTFVEMSMRDMGVHLFKINL